MERFHSSVVRGLSKVAISASGGVLAAGFSREAMTHPGYGEPNDVERDLIRAANANHVYRRLNATIRAFSAYDRRSTR